MTLYININVMVRKGLIIIIQRNEKSANNKIETETIYSNDHCQDNGLQLKTK